MEVKKQLCVGSFLAAVLSRSPDPLVPRLHLERCRILRRFFCKRRVRFFFHFQRNLERAWRGKRLHIAFSSGGLLVIKRPNSVNFGLLCRGKSSEQPRQLVKIMVNPPLRRAQAFAGTLRYLGWSCHLVPRSIVRLYLQTPSLKPNHESFREIGVFLPHPQHHRPHLNPGLHIGL